MLKLMGSAAQQWQVKGLSEQDYEKNSSKIRLDVSCLMGATVEGGSLKNMFCKEMRELSP